jgi:autotransporter-associated beta strand protein
MLFVSEIAPARAKSTTRRKLAYGTLMLGAVHAGAASAFGLASSLNWSGWYATPSSGSFTDITATWVVPTLTKPSSGTSYCATWIGFDGTSDATVEQCGIEDQISSTGSQSLFAWYEFAPQSAVNVGLTVLPGDTINAEVKYDPSQSTGSNFAYIFTIKDGAQSFSQTEFTTSNDARSSAEWIVEAPMVSGSQGTLANFSSASFSNATAAINSGSSTGLGSLANTSGIEMLQTKTGPVIAFPSNINVANNAFTDYYASGLPSLTWKGTSTFKTWDVTSTVWNTGSATVAYGDGCAVTFNDSNGGTADYNVTLNTTVLPGSVTVNNSSNNYVFSGAGHIAGSGSLTKNGSDSLTLSTANTYTGGTTVNAGKLIIGATSALADGAVTVTGGTIQLGASTGAQTIKSLSISGTGKFDVNNDHLIINYSGASDPISSVIALLSSGYSAGTWTGNGIMSSAAASNSASYGLGYADSADSGNPAGLAANTIDIQYTLLGDVNLDKAVNGVDFGIVAANFNKSVSRWDQGDFNYDHVVNGVDFGKLAANFNKGASGASDVIALDEFAAANGLLADVPEPATAGLALLASASILTRRRRARPSRI